METTGADPLTARIVQVSVGVAAGPGEWDPWDQLVNPGVPIPKAASDIHGITDDQVVGSSVEAEVALQVRDRLYEVWDRGGVVVGMNVVYDFTVLDRALARAGVDPFDVRGPVVDPYVLDKAVDKYRRGSRKLEALCVTYGVPLDQAHSADADSFATVRVAWQIVENRHVPGIEALDGSAMPLRDFRLRDLHDFQAEAYEQQQLSLHDYFGRKGIVFDPWSTEWPIIPRDAVMRPGTFGGR